MAVAVEALTAGSMAAQGVQSAPSVSSDQWLVIGLLVTLLLLEAVVQPTIKAEIVKVIGVFKQQGGAKK